MDTHDKNLISQAQRTHCTCWFHITDLIPRAHADDTKAELRRIKNAKYHEEEYYANSL